ncbi:hypothetical protein GEMRC1_005577 [Eukaryota sp. GEM-RC1]
MFATYLFGSLTASILSVSITYAREHDLYNTLWVLAHNKLCLLLSLNLLLALTLSLVSTLKRWFFGTFDASELELLKFKLRLTIPNFIYIVTLSGAGDFAYCIPVNLALLLFKIGHWIVTDRLEKLGNSLLVTPTSKIKTIDVSYDLLFSLFYVSPSLTLPLPSFYTLCRLPINGP